MNAKINTLLLVIISVALLAISWLFYNELNVLRLAINANTQQSQQAQKAAQQAAETATDAIKQLTAMQQTAKAEAAVSSASHTSSPLKVKDRYEYNNQDCIAKHLCYRYQIDMAWVNNDFINNTMKDMLISNIADEDAAETDMDTVIKSFENLMKQNLEKRLAEQGSEEDTDEEDALVLFFYYEQSFVSQQKNIATMYLHLDAYLGGAHNTEVWQYVNFDIEKNKQLTIKDFLKPSATAKAAMIQALREGYRQVMREEREESNEDIMQLEANFEADIQAAFDNPENFFLDEEGVHFLFNAGEIAPSALGLLIINISLEKARAFISPDYIK